MAVANTINSQMSADHGITRQIHANTASENQSDR
jgi:hypothetical protein